MKKLFSLIGGISSLIWILYVYYLCIPYLKNFISKPGDLIITTGTFLTLYLFYNCMSTIDYMVKIGRGIGLHIFPLFIFFYFLSKWFIPPEQYLNTLLVFGFCVCFNKIIENYTIAQKIKKTTIKKQEDLHKYLLHTKLYISDILSIFVFLPLIYFTIAHFTTDITTFYLNILDKYTPLGAFVIFGLLIAIITVIYSYTIIPMITKIIIIKNRNIIHIDKTNEMTEPTNKENT